MIRRIRQGLIVELRAQLLRDAYLVVRSEDAPACKLPSVRPESHELVEALGIEPRDTLHARPRQFPGRIVSRHCSHLAEEWVFAWRAGPGSDAEWTHRLRFQRRYINPEKHPSEFR